MILNLSSNLSFRRSEIKLGMFYWLPILKWNFGLTINPKNKTFIHSNSWFITFRLPSQTTIFSLIYNEQSTFFREITIFWSMEKFLCYISILHVLMFIRWTISTIKTIQYVPSLTNITFTCHKSLLFLSLEIIFSL
jgi:hypothetical protein